MKNIFLNKILKRFINSATAPFSLVLIGGCGENEDKSSFFASTKIENGTTDLTFVESTNFTSFMNNADSTNIEESEKNYSVTSLTTSTENLSENRLPIESFSTITSEQVNEFIFNETSPNVFVVVGNAIKGPLENAVIFLDFNNDGLLNKYKVARKDGSGNISGFEEYVEPFVRSNIYGAFEIISEIKTDEDVYRSDGTIQKASEARLVTITDENTVDRSSDKNLPDVMLSAPAGSTVITPLTTLMEVGNLSSEQIKVALGLENVALLPEFTSFNHYLSETFREEAVKIENFSQQVIATVSAYSGLTPKVIILSFFASSADFKITSINFSLFLITWSEGKIIIKLSSPSS